MLKIIQSTSLCCESCKSRSTPHLKIQACAGCRIAHYCSLQCQKMDWTKHKLICTRDNGRKCLWAKRSYRLFASEFKLPDCTQALAENGYMVIYHCNISNLATYMKIKNKKVKKEKKENIKSEIQKMMQVLIQKLNQMEWLKKEESSDTTARRIQVKSYTMDMYLEALVGRPNSLSIPSGYNFPSLGKKCAYYYISGSAGESQKEKSGGTYNVFCVYVFEETECIIKIV